YQVTLVTNHQLQLRFANSAIHFDRVRVGDLVWRSHDPEIDKICKPFTKAETPVHTQPLRVFVTARAGEHLRVEWSVENNKAAVRAVVESDSVLAPSERHPATIEYLRQQLGRLGGTAY